MSIYIFSDGGSRSNPGKAGYGFVVYKGELEIEKSKVAVKQPLVKITEGKKYLGVTTNNVAEWQGCLAGLKAGIEAGLVDEKVCVALDSLLVINQIQGLWKIKQPHFRPLFEEAKKLISQYNYPVSFKHVYREFNSEADALANQAMDAE